MAKRPRFSDVSADAAADARMALLDGGHLHLCAGKRPASVTTETDGSEMLASLHFETPAFQPAQHGIATAHPITPDESAAGSGRARWFRAVTAAGDVVIEGTVGTSDADLVMNDPEIRPGSIVRVTSFTHTEPKKE